MEEAEGLTDNSAPRATLKAQKIQNLLLVISMNLQLMRDNGCPVKKDPISTARYMMPALQCNTELLNARVAAMSGKSTTSPGLPPICDTLNWKPMGKQPEASQ